jgi:hypothetical protein
LIQLLEHEVLMNVLLSQVHLVLAHLVSFQEAELAAVVLMHVVLDALMECVKL